MVEILVVMTIIVALLAVAGKMMGGGNAGQATRAAGLELKALAELAQARAMANGAGAALLVYNKYDSTGASDRYLRFVVVAERQLKDANIPDVYVWRPSGNGTYLTKGAFYWPNGLNTGFQEAFTADGDLDFGLALQGTAKSDWIGLVFNSQGLPETGAIKNPKLLVAVGTPGSAGLEVTEKEKLLTEGFMVQSSNGRTIAIESPASQLE